MNILAVDPGSTSTKIGLLLNGKIYKDTIYHDRRIIDSFGDIYEQRDFRCKAILEFLKNHGEVEKPFDAVVARGGLLKPIEGGIYAVNDRMLEDLKSGRYGVHASNLGGIIAYEYSRRFNCPAFVVDPPTVDEMLPIAKLSGFKYIERRSIFHALNQRAAARKAAKELGKRYEELNIIVAHMGGGISVGAHMKGRVVDVNNALDGDGPYAVERTGSLPAGDLIRLIVDGKFAPEELLGIFFKKGGVYSYLGTTDMVEIENSIKNGNSYAKLVVDGLIYQVSKEIGSLSVVFNGNVDGVVLTGGLANSSYIVDGIKKRVSFIADVFVFLGEFEIETLLETARMALAGEIQIKTYE